MLLRCRFPGVWSGQRKEELLQFLLIHAALFLGQALLQSAGNNGEASPIQRLGYSSQLGDDILAVAALFQHAGHGGELALGALQSIDNWAKVSGVEFQGVPPKRGIDFPMIYPAGFRVYPPGYRTTPWTEHLGGSARFTPMVKAPPPADGPDAIRTLIELLARKGYDSTSVDELAEAIGMSRSTFFRRFGSKDDIAFADHEALLARIERHMADSTQGALETVTASAMLVFEHHLRHQATSRARYELLQQVPALRDRELVTSYRYERMFRAHLQEELPESDRRSYGATAFAASVVAVHNSMLRRWLREPQASPSDTLRAELIGLESLYRPFLYSAASEQKNTVTVTVVSGTASPEDVIAAIRKEFRQS